ncbi:MAG: DegV family protein [Lawsonibacter sp.]
MFNSCSAAAGEVLIALKIRELASTGMPFKRVVREVEQYIYQLQTLFVLESLENLRKNGRLTRVQSVVTGALRIKLFMGATPEGEICKLGQALIGEAGPGQAGGPNRRRPGPQGTYGGHQPLQQCLERAFRGEAADRGQVPGRDRS